MLLASLLFALAPASVAAPASDCVASVTLTSASAIALPGFVPQGEENANGDEIILVDKMAAIINDQVLTFRQVQIETVQFAKDRGLDIERPGLMLAVARNLLIDMIFREGFRQSGLSESMIDQVVNDEIQRQLDHAGSAAAFAIDLEEQGVTLEEKRAKIQQSLLAMFFQQAELGMAPQLGTKSFRAFLSVAPSEIRNYYQEHTAEYTSPRRVSARILMLQNDSKEDTQQFMLDLKSQITDSTSFAELAAKHSFFRPDQDSLTGSIEVEHQSYAAPLKEFMNQAKKGDFSEPIELYSSWALVHVIDVVEQKVLSVGEAHAQIENTLMRNKKGRALQNAIDRLRKRCYIWLTPDLEGVLDDVYGMNPTDEEEL